MKILKFISGIRNHWKKTTFGVLAISYGINYGKESYEIRQLMKSYCEEAVKYGDNSIDALTPPKRVIVLLNPAANKRSAEKNFQKYCEPILHLAGYLVEIVQTDSVGHARRYVEEDLNKLPDAILVAGGDGTMSETLTGLLRRHGDEKCPIGILPVGRTNEIATKLFSANSYDNVEEVRNLALTAIAVVRGRTNKKDVMEVQPLPDREENPEKPESLPRPIYAMGSLQWGAFRDVQNLRDNYWYVGPLREYAASLFNAFSNKLTWNCKTKLIYTPPCSGCKNCYIKTEKKELGSGRWWSKFIPRFKLGQQSSVQKIDFSKIINNNCNVENILEVSPTEIILNSNDQEVSKLVLNVNDSVYSGFDFLSQSWKRIRSHKIETEKLIEGRTITLVPEIKETGEQEHFYYIDNEPFEVRPIKIRVIPKAVNVYVL